MAQRKKAASAAPARSVTTDGIRTTALTSPGARKITLEPLQVIPLDGLAVREVESTIPCGFRFDWISGDGAPGGEFRLTCGAGVGSPWLEIAYRDRGFCLDIRDLLMRVLNFADAHERPPLPEDGVKEGPR